MLRLDIVTPAKKAFSDDVESVVVPGIQGEFGILTAHAPLVTSLQPGELRYVKDGKETSLAIGGGVVEVSYDKISLLTDMAFEEADIDEDAVEKALERAQKALSEKPEAEEMAAIEMTIAKSLAQLQIKRKRRQL